MKTSRWSASTGDGVEWPCRCRWRTGQAGVKPCYLVIFAEKGDGLGFFCLSNLSSRLMLLLQHLLNGRSCSAQTWPK
jgi:hypothetical protein